jgi:hypothetical protein
MHKYWNKNLHNHSFLHQVPEEPEKKVENGMDNGAVEEKEEEEDEGGDWRNHLKRMMDEIKKVQDLPKVRERRHAGTGGTTSRE